ncbi:PREDICTED: GATA transcription factor 9-like [Ipomoea nil]|uniref:GATA transcription factor 9-like n=1 Tax=Ipomoea nil TaxID=35883 RepID=UPI0009013400|nr:PREDICTED: GATA transcription factor 9-like [Ipomoea nil]
METPDFFQPPTHYTTQFTPDKRHPSATADSKNNNNAADHFVVDDLLDFPNDDTMLAVVSDADAAALAADSSSATACNSSPFSAATQFAPAIACRNHLTDAPFSGEFFVPYEDVAELEWLSNFVEESFSSEDLQKLQLISGMKAGNEDESSQSQSQSQTHHFQPEPNPATTFRPEMAAAVPAKARSKRSRAAAPCNWTSRLLVSLSPSVDNVTTTTTTPAISSSSESDLTTSSSGKKTAAPKKKDAAAAAAAAAGSNGEGRKCLHCATDKTPQWRTGPMGPKTLCNACGVRYKSGRLVPEYRPASSPTFVLTKHSNSHRKVLEIRRQKELVRAQQHHHQFLHQKMMFDVSNGDDYLIHHQHIGPHFRHLI